MYAEASACEGAQNVDLRTDVVAPGFRILVEKACPYQCEKHPADGRLGKIALLDKLRAGGHPTAPPDQRGAAGWRHGRCFERRRQQRRRSPARPFWPICSWDVPSYGPLGLARRAVPRGKIRQRLTRTQCPELASVNPKNKKVHLMDPESSEETQRSCGTRPGGLHDHLSSPPAHRRLNRLRRRGRRSAVRRTGAAGRVHLQIREQPAAHASHEHAGAGDGCARSRPKPTAASTSRSSPAASSAPTPTR